MRTKYLILALLILTYSCVPSKKGEDQRLKVVATTGMIYDAVLNIGGTNVKTEAIMGPGVDPHLYKATQGDLNKLTDADLVFYNGLFLEGKMGEVLEKLGKLKPVMAVAESIDQSILSSSTQHADAFDPHVWFDVSLWIQVVEEVGRQLSWYDSANSDVYKANTLEYVDQLDSLHRWVIDQVSEIPQDQRVLITAHDAFGYFGQAYGVEVRGLQGISTVSEFGLRDINDLVNFIVNRGIKAVFVETSVSEKAINAVIEGCKAKGHEVKIGGSLYSDAMGEFDTFEGSYIGMVTSNVQKIVSALK